jgi:protein gp37
MSDNTSISWAEASLNFATGCTKVSAGCANCYSLDRLIPRLQAMGQKKYQNGTKFTVHESAMYEPLKWKKPRRIFVNSVSDTFHEEMPNETLQRFFQNVVSATPHHTYIILTKRPENMFDFFDQNRVFIPANMPNVWLGVTAENQEMADKRLPILKEIPAAVRFVSVEPMLGPVDLSAYGEWLDWVIIGGESGPKQRIIPVKYIWDLVLQCKQMDVPVFLKQMHDGERLVKEPHIRIPGETEHKQYLEYPTVKL